MNRINTAIIGSGNVAEALAKALRDTDEAYVSQICARNRSRGTQLAEACGASYVRTPEELDAADIYIIAVSDKAVSETASAIPDTADAVVAHTCGGLTIDAIDGKHAHRAVIYPLQTFTSGRAIDMASVPLFTEYSDAVAQDIAGRIARILSRTVTEADSKTRNKLHVAAVLACNFSNHLYYLASRIAAKAGIGFDALKPIITETAAKACSTDDPANVQTGPAVRHDEVTLRRHMEILAAEGDERLTKIYELLSDDIWETSRKI